MCKILVKVYMEKEEAIKLKQDCKSKGVSVSSFIVSKLQGDPVPRTKNPTMSEQSEKILTHFVDKSKKPNKPTSNNRERVASVGETKNGFSEGVKFNNKGFITNPKTDAEIKYNLDMRDSND